MRFGCGLSQSFSGLRLLSAASQHIWEAERWAVDTKSWGRGEENDAATSTSSPPWCGARTSDIPPGGGYCDGVSSGGVYSVDPLWS